MNEGRFLVRPYDLQHDVVAKQESDGQFLIDHQLFFQFFQFCLSNIETGEQYMISFVRQGHVRHILIFYDIDKNFWSISKVNINKKETKN